MSNDNEYLKSDEDVEEILRLAMEKKGQGAEELRERLRTSAADLGLSEEDLRVAEEEYRAKAAAEKAVANRKAIEEAERAETRDRTWLQVKGFLIRLATMGAFMVGIDWFSNREISWSMYAVMGILFVALTRVARTASGAGRSDRFRHRGVGMSDVTWSDWGASGKVSGRVQEARDAYDLTELRKTVIWLLKDGDKAGAVKLVRDETGWELDRAREYVDSLS